MPYETNSARRLLNRSFKLLLPLITLMLLVMPLFAQQNDAVVADIVAFVRERQIWLWTVGDQSPTQITNFSPEWHPDGLRVAPNGRYITFLLSTSVEEPRQYPIYERDTLWLYDVTTSELSQIDGIPPTQEGYIEGRYTIGSVQFAPDSSELMWLEVDWETGSQFIFYNLIQQTRRTLPNVASRGYQDGGDVALPYLLWSTGGLLNEIYTSMDDKGFRSFVEVIDPQTATKQVFDLWQEEMGDNQFPRDKTWGLAEADNQPVIAYRRGSDWYALNPQNGDITRYSDEPTTTLAGYTLTKTLEQRDGINIPINSLMMSDGELVLLPEGTIRFAVSTGGGGVLFGSDNFIGVWQNGSTTLFDLPTDTDLEWRRPVGAAAEVSFVGIEPVTTNTIPVETSFECLLPPLLEIEQTASVALGANVLREYPGLDNAEIGSIPEGASVTILDGPVCRHGYQWWQVDYNGQIGWTAEADYKTGDYWLVASP